MTATSRELQDIAGGCWTFVYSDTPAELANEVIRLRARVRELEALLPPTFPDFYICGCDSVPKDVLHAFCPQHKMPMRTRTETP